MTIRAFRPHLTLFVVGVAAVVGVAGGHPRAQQTTSVVRPGPDILYAAPATSPQLENTGIWKAAPILISGASVYRNGEFLYQDYIYDDRGPLQRGGYPASLENKTNDNAADILEIRVRPDQNATAVRVSYNTLLDPEIVATTIAFGNAVASAKIPFGAGGTAPATVFVTVHGRAGVITNAADGKKIADASVTVDMVRRQVDIRVPYAAFDPRNKTVRIAAAAGLWDVTQGAYLAPTGTPFALPRLAQATAAPAAGRGGRGAPAPLPATRANFFNVAFRYHEPLNTNSTLDFFNDQAQGDALATGDLSPFYADVDFSKLARGVTDESMVPLNGFMSRIFATHFEPEQGRSNDRNVGTDCEDCALTYAGRLQPYGIYVPKKTPPAAGYGLTLDLHSAGANYGRWNGDSRDVQIGERGTGSIVAVPNARGERSHYWGIAAAEVFEVWRDVERFYKIDRDYVSLAGVSMGTIGAFKLAGQFPDLFAAVAGSVGCPNDPSLIGLREVPAMIHSGDIDSTTGCHPGHRALERYLSTNDQYLWWNFIDHPHAFSSLPRDWQPFADFLGTKRRAPDSARVTYALVQETVEPESGLNSDHAYWVSGLKVRDPNVTYDTDKTDRFSTRGPYGEVDVFSHGFGRADPARVAPLRSRTMGVFKFGVDYPWPNYVATESKRAPAPPMAASDEADIDARNIGTVTIDPVRARLTCNARLNVKSDGPITITLLGCPAAAQKF